MDEYAEYLYNRRPHYKNINTGDLTEQKKIRKNLNCKSFKWFIKEVAFDLVKKYPPVEPQNIANGKVCTTSGVSNPRPTGRMWPGVDFDAALTSI